MNGGPLPPGFHDLNGDGVMDTLAFEWNGKAAVFIADSGRLPWDAPKADWNAYFNEAFNADEPTRLWNNARAGWGSYTLLVDRDGDGRFDGAADFFYHALDLNGDGDPEAVYHHLMGYPGFHGQEPPFSNKLHISLDGERDTSYIDFKNFIYAEEQEYDAEGRYYMNVHGSGFFLNAYSPDPRDAWENPIAWYDFDGDGRTNMVMRVTDVHRENGLYRGDVSEFEAAFELNGNTGPGRWHSLDFQLTFYALNRKGPDYRVYEDDIPQLALFPGSESLSGERAAMRGQTTRRYLPYLDGYRLGTDWPGWEGCFMIFDEDDDSNRWEELFSTHETRENSADDFCLCADQIGDRVERDVDFGGGGQVYIGCFDNRLHLYHAEDAYWDIDYFGVWQGAIDHPFPTEGPKPPEGLLYERVRYHDHDGDGYIDAIEYGTVRYGSEAESWTVNRRVDLLQYCTPAQLQTPLTAPGVQSPLTGWKLSNWDGAPFSPAAFEGTGPKEAFDKYEALYAAAAEKMWADAQKLHACAQKLGLNRSERLDADLEAGFSREALAAMAKATVPKGYSRHLAAAGRREMYHHGYWLREKVFADVLCYGGFDEAALCRLYYPGKIDELCEFLFTNTPKVREDKEEEPK